MGTSASPAESGEADDYAPDFDPFADNHHDVGPILEAGNPDVLACLGATPARKANTDVIEYSSSNVEQVPPAESGEADDMHQNDFDPFAENHLMSDHFEGRNQATCCQTFELGTDSVNA
ncbi:hypothetical protein AVEN_224656-1 [Araneus ventricosus]|uniref:Uncharacterized protein n=1 Tax=Araneus ventricosus TaxID=182803 RepID=A0A4Y2MAZ1_ARAVE|nr:hypothetical protein AVEN_224656-1 [Araneus ventricosus]